LSFVIVDTLVCKLNVVKVIVPVTLLTF